MQRFVDPNFESHLAANTVAVVLIGINQVLDSPKAKCEIFSDAARISVRKCTIHFIHISRRAVAVLVTRGRLAKALVVAPDELGNESVGLFNGADAYATHRLNQPILQRSMGPFDTPL